MNKLTISAETFSAFSDESLRRYEEKVVVHLQEVFAETCKALTEPLVRQVVRCGIARAECYGFIQEDNVCSFIDMMFAYGRDFDTKMPWARKILQDSTVASPRERAARLYSTAISHLHLARGITRDEVESGEVL